MRMISAWGPCPSIYYLVTLSFTKSERRSRTSINSCDSLCTLSAFSNLNKSAEEGGGRVRREGGGRKRNRFASTCFYPTSEIVRCRFRGCCSCGFPFTLPGSEDQDLSSPRDEVHAYTVEWLSPCAIIEHSTCHDSSSSSGQPFKL